MISEATIITSNKRPLGDNTKSFVKRKAAKKKYKAKSVEKTSPLGVLEFEIDEILLAHLLTRENIKNDLSVILNEPDTVKQYHVEVNDVTVLRLSSNGDGLALITHPAIANQHQIVVIPFGLPGDIVNIKIFKSHPFYVESDLLKVVKASPHRNDALISCKYFGKCSGCQYQDVEYEQALKFKQQIIENAYKYFAPKLSKIIPAVDNTEPSPLKYNYRTKLTPHFNIPNWVRTKGEVLEERPSFGFGAKGRPQWRQTEGGNQQIVDIEDCPIGTSIINLGMKHERAKFENLFKTYKKGATILLREHTQEKENAVFDEQSESVNIDTKEINKVEVDDKVKTCVTNARYIVNEYVNGYKFKFSAGEFFQNNNSILPVVTDYVKSNLGLKEDEDNYLVDAYCGSGLFSITCSSNVKRVIGVEVSADSVKFANLNAQANNITNAKFIAGKAEEIFKDIDLPNNQTSVILDPPRKGCDEVFLNQLSTFYPAQIVYISCNVHSQARDIEWFINNTEKGHEYEVVSIKGFDFFPQTHHVESVAVLRRK